MIMRNNTEYQHNEIRRGRLVLWWVGIETVSEI